MNLFFQLLHLTFYPVLKITFFLFGTVLLFSGDNDPKLMMNQKESSQDKKLSDGEIKALKDANFDIHGLKGKGSASKKDLFKDKDGNIKVKDKNGKGPGEETGLNIKNFIK